QGLAGATQAGWSATGGLTADRGNSYRLFHKSEPKQEAGMLTAVNFDRQIRIVAQSQTIRFDKKGELFQRPVKDADLMNESDMMKQRSWPRKPLHPRNVDMMKEGKDLATGLSLSCDQQLEISFRQENGRTTQEITARAAAGEEASAAGRNY